MDAIIDAGKKVETAILNGGDRTGADLEFHNAIVTATHNEFLQRLIPVIHRAVSDAIAMRESEKLSRDTVQDHAMIMDFMKAREPEGAKDAMRIHIHHAIQNLNLRETE
jgi:DNA-binding FadR family transcriptional regulator